MFTKELVRLKVENTNANLDLFPFCYVSLIVTYQRLSFSLNSFLHLLSRLADIFSLTRICHCAIQRKNVRCVFVSVGHPSRSCLVGHPIDLDPQPEMIRSL